MIAAGDRRAGRWPWPVFFPPPYWGTLSDVRLGDTHDLAFEIGPQPDDTTCGPTCLHAIYKYYGDTLGLETVVRDVTSLPGGGTLAVWLACDALRRGYAAIIYTYNLQIFDPSWFEAPKDLSARLQAQRLAKDDPKLDLATTAYLEFFALGGQLRFEPLTAGLIRRWLKRRTPILTGLSATYLYGCAREFDDKPDDVRGYPVGHFVVLGGYDAESREVKVADPLHDNPGFGSGAYAVGVPRLIAAILLGIVTYDANLLVITPMPRVA